MNRLSKFSVIPLLLLLVACGSSGVNKELTDYIAATKARPAGNIEPLPVFKPFEAYIYSSTAKRSPFDRPLDVTSRVYAQGGSDVKPDFNRAKEFLEGFDLSSLQMVGTIEKGGTLWALISDAGGDVYWVTNGNYMGKNHGRIVETSETQVELVEIVSDGLDGWVERPRVIALIEKE